MGGEVRDDVVKAVPVPVLFVQGTRDKMCPLDQLKKLFPRMKAQARLHTVETGDHSLEITKAHSKAAGVSQSDIDSRVLGEVRSFVVDVLAGKL